MGMTTNVDEICERKASQVWWKRRRERLDVDGISKTGGGNRRGLAPMSTTAGGSTKVQKKIGGNRM